MVFLDLLFAGFYDSWLMLWVSWHRSFLHPFTHLLHQLRS